ncbi:DUF6297 family protein [Aestuariimicrobium kwangyangense]|uniref:DUF6297 family protein n=1 Tax=Aestuariimicrobium kwangyangense TaxID=396389 RepID=UPI0003B6F5A3|nr:DUF6297 family protein [Aestuariimicrobium kwangyangense]
MSRLSRKKSGPKATAPKAGQASEPVVVLAEQPEALPEPARLVVQQDVNSLHQHQVDERQLQLLIKDWRRGRATRSVGQMLSDAYVALFSVAVIAAMMISSLIRAQSLAADCSADSCGAARGLLPWAALAGVLGLALGAARMFGPVLASAAEGFWLMEAPLRRSKLLAARLLAAILLALVGGAAVGALTSTLTGSSGDAVIAWTVATGLGAAGLTAMAAAEQGAERTWIVKTIQAIVSLVGLTALLLVVATASGWIDLGLTDNLAVELAAIVAAAGLLLAVGAGIIARTRLDRIRRSRLTSGGSLISGMQGAMFAMDFGLMRDILVEREAVDRGHVRPTRGRGTGLTALVLRDVQRIIRFPKPWVLLAASVVVPYSVQALGLGRLVVPIAAIVLMAALIPFFTSLRILSRTKGLARAFPFTTAQIRTATCVVPGVLALVWGIAVTPAFVGVGGTSMVGKTPVDAAMWALVTGFAGMLAAMRWQSAKSANYQAPMVATSMGAMPPGLMFNLVRGFDMVALMSVPAVFGWTPWISVVLGIIIFSFLRVGGIDPEEMRELQEQQKKQLNESRLGQAAGNPAPGKGASSKPAGKATTPAGQKIRIKRGE